MFDAGPPPKLWKPQAPAIIRPAGELLVPRVDPAMLVVPPPLLKRSAGSVWTPSSLPGIWDWWTSKAGVTESGGPVSAWAGQFASTAMTQGTANNKPTWSATSFNSSYPGITFDPASFPQYLRNTGIVGINNETAFSVFILFTMNTGQPFPGIVSYVASGNANDFSSANSFALTGGNTSAAVVLTLQGTSLGFTSTTVHLAVWAINSSSMRLYVDGVDTGVEFGVWPIGNNNDDMTFGTRPWNSFANNLDGKLALVGLTKSTLSQSDVNDLKSYCNAQFGTSF